MVRERPTGHYLDGTPITSPFWLMNCTSCGHETLNTQYSDTCLKCGAPATCIPANEVKRNWDGTIKKSQSN